MEAPGSSPRPAHVVRSESGVRVVRRRHRDAGPRGPLRRGDVRRAVGAPGAGDAVEQFVQGVLPGGVHAHLGQHHGVDRDPAEEEDEARGQRRAGQAVARQALVAPVAGQPVAEGRQAHRRQAGQDQEQLQDDPQGGQQPGQQRLLRAPTGEGQGLQVVPLGQRSAPPPARAEMRRSKPARAPRSSVRPRAGRAGPELCPASTASGSTQAPVTCSARGPALAPYAVRYAVMGDAGPCAGPGWPSCRPPALLVPGLYVPFTEAWMVHDPLLDGQSQLIRNLGVPSSQRTKGCQG